MDLDKHPDRLEPTEVVPETQQEPEAPPVVTAFTVDIGEYEYTPKDGTNVGTARAEVSLTTAFNLNSQLGDTHPDEYVAFTVGEGSSDGDYPVLDVKSKDLYLDENGWFSRALRIENLPEKDVVKANEAGGFLINAGVIQHEINNSPRNPDYKGPAEQPEETVAARQEPEMLPSGMK